MEAIKNYKMYPNGRFDIVPKHMILTASSYNGGSQKSLTSSAQIIVPPGEKRVTIEFEDGRKYTYETFTAFRQAYGLTYDVAVCMLKNGIGPSNGKITFQLCNSHIKPVEMVDIQTGEVRVVLDGARSVAQEYKYSVTTVKTCTQNGTLLAHRYRLRYIPKENV